MECTHFKKANFLKRLFGIQGYYAIRKTNIKQYSKYKYLPRLNYSRLTSL